MMFDRRKQMRRRVLGASVAALLGFSLAAVAGSAYAGFARVGAVGGVYIDADGLLRAPTVAETKELIAARRKELASPEADLEEFSKLRKVSLRRLNEAIATHRSTKRVPLPEEIQLLAGLQRIDYVFVYPEQNDVVIAGPAEGWKVNDRGDIVGKTTDLPVMHLDDLLAALRYARRGPIQCSIDPTARGIAGVRKLAGKLNSGGRVNPARAADLIEKTLGMQVVSVGGVPADSHFARVLVAADYQMKRLAMDFEEAPVKGLPSFMDMTRTPSGNMLPRWWLAPKADPLLASPDGLSWQIRGLGVQCKTEEDFVNKEGQRVRTGQAGTVAQQWADKFTEKYDELSTKKTIFGQLRNLMNLAVVGALVSKENMFERASLKPLHLLSEEPLETFHVPKQVDSKATIVRKGRGWMISASGGVQMYPAQMIQETEKSDSLSGMHKGMMEISSSWWWD